MKIDPSSPANRFSSVLPITVSTRLVGGSEASWRELDRGPGFFAIPAGYEAACASTISTTIPCPSWWRSWQDALPSLKSSCLKTARLPTAGSISLNVVPQATSLNLSSCGLTDAGLETLAGFFPPGPAEPELLQPDYRRRVNEKSAPWQT